MGGGKKGGIRAWRCRGCPEDRKWKGGRGGRGVVVSRGWEGQLFKQGGRQNGKGTEAGREPGTMRSASELVYSLIVKHVTPPFAGSPEILQVPSFRPAVGSFPCFPNCQESCFSKSCFSHSFSLKTNFCQCSPKVPFAINSDSRLPHVFLFCFDMTFMAY